MWTNDTPAESVLHVVLIDEVLGVVDHHVLDALALVGLTGERRARRCEGADSEQQPLPLAWRRPNHDRGHTWECWEQLHLMPELSDGFAEPHVDGFLGLVRLDELLLCQLKPGQKRVVGALLWKSLRGPGCSSSSRAKASRPPGRSQPKQKKPPQQWQLVAVAGEPPPS